MSVAYDLFATADPADAGLADVDPAGWVPGAPPVLGALHVPDALPVPAGPRRRHLYDASRARASAVPVPVPVLPSPEVESVPRAVREASVSVLRAPSTGSAPLRLTRRGVAVLSAVVATVAGALVWLAALSAPDASASAPAVNAPAQVTVHAGDTLWAIASRVAPDRDPRAEVAHLRRLNRLGDSGLTPGQVLRVR